MTDTPAPNDMPDEPKLPQVNDVINLLGHSWKVYGIHLGAVGVESLIELESLTHRSGWTGEWESHPRVFVPEVFVRHAMNTPADLRAPVAAGGEVDTIIRTIQSTMCPTTGMIEGELVTRMEGRISEHALHLIIKALQQPPAPAVDLEKMSAAYEEERAKYIGGTVYYTNNLEAFKSCMAKALAAQGMIKGVE